MGGIRMKYLHHMRAEEAIKFIDMCNTRGHYAYKRGLIPTWNQKEEICLKAVEEDGLLIRFVKTKTDSICMAAIKQNPWALNYIENPSKEMIVNALNSVMTVVDSYKTADEVIEKIFNDLTDIKEFVRFIARITSREKTHFNKVGCTMNGVKVRFSDSVLSMMICEKLIEYVENK